MPGKKRQLLTWSPIRLSILCALGLLFAGCEGGATQGASSLMIPGSSGASALAPAGSTIVRVHLPATGGAATPLSSHASVQSSIAVAPVAPFASPSPFPVATVPGASPTPFPVAAMTLSVAGPASMVQTIQLGPGSPGCSSAANGTTCQTALSLPAGTYAATVGLYGSNAISPATILATPQSVAFTVPPNGGSAVNLTFTGAPAQLAVLPASPTTVVNPQGTIDLYGAGKHQLVVEMLDAKQNVIIGAGVPSFALTQAGGALSLSVAQTNSTTANLFTVTASPAPSSATATLRVAPNPNAANANACALAICSTNVTLDVRQLLAVANSSANTVALFAGSTTPIATVQQGITDPQALVFDSAGNLFVANQAGSVTEYAPPYAGAPNTISQGVTHPQALTIDAHGNLFVASGSGSNTVTEYAPPYNGAPSATISSGIDDPVGLGVDGNGNLFVANQAANTVTVYASPYTGSPTTISNGLSAPSSLAIDARGNLFVANLNSTPNSVVEYAAPFSSASVPAVTIANGVNEQGAIGLSAAATLFVPNQGANTVTEYTAPYTGTPTTITGGQNQPIALAVDGTNDLYVANYGNNTVTEYAQPYTTGSWTTYSTGIANPMALALSPPTNAPAAIVP